MAPHGLSVRGDSLYCPLSLSLDAYWNCGNDCWHCYLRRLNHIWGKEYRPIDPEELERKLVNGERNKNPQTFLAWALKNKKTLRFGNKADPFQPVEQKYKVAGEALKVLIRQRWSFVIQTMCTGLMMDYKDLIIQAKEFVVVQPIISCGQERDWEVLERRRTTPIGERFHHLRVLKRAGIKVAVNGEPFIPGFHTVNDFEDMLKRLKNAGIKNYNVYNFHFNDFVAKRLLDIGLDIEAIWVGNQDSNWRPVQLKLIELAKKYDIILGCPDFVNSGKEYFQITNTCCGIDVQNPMTFNTHNWKRLLQAGEADKEKMLNWTWEGVGDFEEGKKILSGKSDKFYTMKDI